MISAPDNIRGGAVAHLPAKIEIMGRPGKPGDDVPRRMIESSP